MKSSYSCYRISRVPLVTRTTHRRTPGHREIVYDSHGLLNGGAAARKSQSGVTPALLESKSLSNLVSHPRATRHNTPRCPAGTRGPHCAVSQAAAPSPRYALALDGLHRKYIKRVVAPSSEAAHATAIAPTCDNATPTRARADPLSPWHARTWHHTHAQAAAVPHTTRSQPASTRGARSPLPLHL